jgi:hypothetical protein
MFTTYCWQRDEFTWEGATKAPKKDPINFVNHSCNPNMYFKNDYTLIARRDIKNGEALSIDYATCDTKYATIDECECGEPDCRKKVTNDDYKDPAIINKYLPFVRSFLLR